MNKINFELRDIETIDLTMGMGIKKVYPPIENLEVIPTKEQQVFNHENSYGYDNVTVEPIPDEYIIPDGTLPITENATYDVRRFARVSTAVKPAPVLQDKELTINENGTHNITYDEGYDGLNQVSVTVDAIEDLSEELTDYGNGLTKQGVTIDDITKALQNKAISGGDDMVRYSTEETLIGTWIDGKPLYRKVINVDISIFTAETNSISYDFSTLDMCIDVRAITERQYNMIEVIPRTASSKNLDAWYGGIQLDKAGNRFIVELGSSMKDRVKNGYRFFIIFEYTKTTD